MIHLPFDSPDVSSILMDLTATSSGWRRSAPGMSGRPPSARLAIRIRTVFDLFGLAPTEKMQQRAEQLARIAG